MNPQPDLDLLTRVLDLQMGVTLLRRPRGRFIIARALTERFPFFEKMRPSDQAVTLWTDDAAKARKFLQASVQAQSARLRPLGNGDFVQQH